MSLSAEYCTDKSGDRCGGGGAAALAHQRRLIQGLLVWATLLTLGLGTSITLHFIHRVTDPADLKTEPKEIPLMVFEPNWDQRDDLKLLKWKTVQDVFIEGSDKLKVKEDGHYFLYLQVTLDPQQKENHTISVRSEKREVILKGLINGSKLSSIFMAKGISLDSGDVLTVTCDPAAKIVNSRFESHLGVIKLYSA